MLTSHSPALNRDYHNNPGHVKSSEPNSYGEYKHSIQLVGLHCLNNVFGLDEPVSIV